MNFLLRKGFVSEKSWYGASPGVPYRAPPKGGAPHQVSRLPSEPAPLGGAPRAGNQAGFGWLALCLRFGWLFLGFALIWLDFGLILLLAFIYLDLIGFRFDLA